MAEPTSATVAAWAATASAVTLAVIGVDYYSLLFGLVGAMFSLAHAEQMGRLRAVVYVALSALGGAVIGNLANEWMGGKSRILLIGLCLAGGIIAQAIAAAIVHTAPRIADKAGKVAEGIAERWASQMRSSTHFS